MIQAQDLREDVQFVVTLVHGTWAKNAAWIRPGSAISDALNKCFGQRAKVFPFNWTGRNSPTARRKASEKLGVELQQRLEEYTSARHYLICHSHGGYVGLRALADFGLEEKISGVICLATPFLVARERDLGTERTAGLIGAFSLAALCATFAWVYQQPRTWGTWWETLAWLVAYVVAFSLLGTFVVVPMAKKGPRFIEELLRDMVTPTIGHEKIMIVRSPGDEASGAIIFSQILSQLSVALFVRTMRLYKWSNAIYLRWNLHGVKKMLVVALAIMVSTIAFVLGAVAYISPPYLNTESWANEAVIVGAALFGLIGAAGFLVTGWANLILQLMAGGVLWLVILLLSVLLVLPLGWRIAMANIYVDVTAETTPPGSWMVDLVEAPTSKEFGKDLPLLHSLIYENPRVLELICNWVATGVRR